MGSLLNRCKAALHTQLIPLSEGIDPPAERIPEPTWIAVTKEERERMFEPCANVVVETANSVEDMTKLMKQTEEKLIWQTNNL